MVIATFKRIIYIRLFRAVRNTRISPIGMYLAYKGTGLGDEPYNGNARPTDIVGNPKNVRSVTAEVGHVAELMRMQEETQLHSSQLPSHSSLYLSGVFRSHPLLKSTSRKSGCRNSGDVRLEPKRSVFAASWSFISTLPLTLHFFSKAIVTNDKMVPALRKILIINPNSTRSMTNALKPLVDSLGYSSTQHTYFTAPSGPASINNEDDAAESARHCLEPLLPLLETHDAFLVCCYSAHPLVGQLKARPEVAGRRKPVTGIFEASISSSLQAIGPGERFGIVSTGKVWEATLREAVDNYLGVEDNTEGSAAFAGVQTTGLNATELHDTSPVEVRSRMKKAVATLLMDDAGGPVGAVCLGCAGMAGFDDMVREAAIETLGHGQGSKVRIVDGVVAGVTWLEGALRSGILPTCMEDASNVSDVYIGLCSERG
ncbi:hypothetical protein KCV06_g268, partial [Aureobasidium melanogenum]